MSIAKPQLRGLLQNQIKKNLTGAIIFTISLGVAFKFLVAEPKKQKYADFYKTYDAQKRFEIMRDAGLLESVGPK